MKITDIVTEAANPAQQAAIAISMKKAGKKPKQGVAEGSLNELSKDTLKSYAKKAVPDMQASQKKSEIEAGKAASAKDDETAKTHHDAAKQAKDRTEKRMAGISGAIKRVTKQGVAEGYILKKTNVSKYMEPGDPDEYTQDVNVKDTDYEIINNKTGQVVGTASWTTNDFFGPGALKITMKNGATRWLDIWEREKGNPQSAFNRFVKDPKTAKKYKDEQGVAEGSLNELSKDTLKSYAKKAVPDMQASQKKSEIEAGKAASTKDDKTAKTHYDAAKQAKDRTEKRMAGISGAIKRVTKQGVAEHKELAEEFDLIESIVEQIAQHNGVDADVVWEDLESLTEDELYAFAVTSEPIMESQDMAEDTQQVDSLVTDALKIMRGSESNDAVAALKTVLGDREYNGRRGFYNFYIRQLMDMYSQQGVMEDWQKANKRDKTDGMSQKAVNSYRREHPGSKLKTAVTTKPSKLKKGSKASKRRSSYCSRSRGQMKMHSISCSKTPDKAICKARRRWNC